MTSEPVDVLRFADVVLIVLAAPFVIAFGLPALGYAVGAAAWALQRLAADALAQRARRAVDVRSAVGIQLGGSFARAWLVGITILAVGLAGNRDDGAMAAALVLVAFTIHLGISLLLASLRRSAPR